MLPSVSIVVPTHFRSALLPGTLTALLAADYSAPLEIIVIHDGDDAGTRRAIEPFFGPRLRFAEQPQSGAAAARNRGATMAQHDLLLFVDDDIVVTPTFVDQHVRTLQAHGDAIVNGRWIYEPLLKADLEATAFGRFRMSVEEWDLSSRNLPPAGDGCFELGAVSSCNLSVLRSTFFRLGAFDETFPFAGYEDLEFSVRARRAGIAMIYNPQVVVWHNDRRLSFPEFCLRHERGAVGVAIFATKWPEEFIGAGIVKENGPLRASDGARRIVKTITKMLLSHPAALVAVQWALRAIETVNPRAPFLARVYWSVSGIYIFRGFRDGLRRAASRSGWPAEQSSAVEA